MVMDIDQECKKVYAEILSTRTTTPTLAMMLLLQAFWFYYGLPVASGLFNYHSVSSGNESVYAKALLTLTTDMT